MKYTYSSLVIHHSGGIATARHQGVRGWLSGAITGSCERSAPTPALRRGVHGLEFPARGVDLRWHGQGPECGRAAGRVALVQPSHEAPPQLGPGRVDHEADPAAAQQGTSGDLQDQLAE